MPEVDDAVYVYGVAAKAAYDPASASGVEGVEVETVEHEGLVALTSRLHSDTLTARDVRAHWRVLERVFEQQATVLPMRFGTVMESRDAVRDRLLAPNSDQLADLLEQMDGLVQLNVKGRYNEELLLRDIVKRSSAIARLRDRVRSGSATPAQQIELGRLVDAEIERARAADAGAVLRRLERLAVAATDEQVDHPNAFDLAFLVERAREGDFGGGVARLRQDFGDRVELRYVGPLPPFSFAQADLTIGSEAWA